MEEIDFKINIERRNFLKAFIRAMIAALLLLVPTYLIAKKRVSADPSACDLDIQCSGCSKQNGCQLIKQ